LAGGNVAGGKVLADWPGLAKGQLLDGRDLKPTIDLRSVIGPVLQRQFALTVAQLQAVILPGSSKPSINLWRT
jgi:uncharacterized protein (DUF1501 family)